MAKQLTADQSGRVAEKIMEWGNLVFIGLVITQVIPGPFSNPAIVVVGVVNIASAYLFAIRLMKGGGE